MKRPSAPKLKAPKLKAPKVQAPGFVGDLFRDLRDRRLLLPALALIAALIAVPTLLARSAEPAPPPPPAADSAEASATSAAVLAVEEVGVRDYRKRLEELKSKNPFEQQFPLPDVSSTDDLDVTDPGLGDASTAGTSSGATADTSSATSAAGTSVTPSTSGDSGGGDTSAPKPPQIEPVYFTREIDVLVGPVGSTVERNGVEQLRLLPSNAKPVVAFLGVTQDGKEAVFAVSADVASVSGGECVPSDSNCAYVVLGEGDDATFDYTPDGVTYRLKLRKIRSVKLKGADSVQLP